MRDVAEACRTQHHVQKTQTTFRSANGKEKQLDYTLTSRRHLKFSKDAEANDMLHMGSDHRSAMAQFVIPAKDWKGSQAKHRKANKLTDPIEGNGLSERVEISTFEERYHELEMKVLKVKDIATKTEHPEQEIAPKQKGNEENLEDVHNLDATVIPGKSQEMKMTKKGRTFNKQQQRQDKKNEGVCEGMAAAAAATDICARSDAAAASEVDGEDHAGKA